MAKKTIEELFEGYEGSPTSDGWGDEYVQTSIDFDAAVPARTRSSEEVKLVIYASYISGDVDAVSQLNKTLGEYGLRVEIDDAGNKEKCVTINLDTRTLKQKTSRGAGAKYKYVGVDISLEDLKARIDAEGAQAVADSIGVSRSTLFRRIRNCEACHEQTVLF